MLNCSHIDKHRHESSHSLGGQGEMHHLRKKRKKPTYFKNWKKKQEKEFLVNRKCIQPTSDKFIKPLFESNDMLEITLSMKSSNHMPFMLCQKCYNDVYQIFHPQTPCTSCGAIPKEGTHWCHHSPDASFVSQHIQDTTGTELHMSSSDYICNTCYKTGLSILNELHSEKQEPKCTLQSAMQTWLAKVDNNSTNKSFLLVAQS